MGRVNRGRSILSIFSVDSVFCLIIPSFILCPGGEGKEDLRPERGIAVYPEYSGVIVSKGETVRMDLTLENKGRTDETIDVKISTIPKGWKATLERSQLSGHRDVCAQWEVKKSGPDFGTR